MYRHQEPFKDKTLEVSLLLEEKVRQEAATIDLGFVGGVGKARQFLKVAKRVSERARQIGFLCYRFAHSGDWERANRFRKAYDQMCDLHSELREKARHAIRQPDSLGFDVSPTPLAYGQGNEVAR